MRGFFSFSGYTRFGKRDFMLFTVFLSSNDSVFLLVLLTIDKEAVHGCGKNGKTPWWALGAKLSLAIRRETMVIIEKASDEHGVAAGTIARDALERGLKQALNYLQKQHAR